MPKITDLKIQKSNKARANLYLDGEFSFGLEMVTVLKLGLKIGQDVSAEKLQEAVFDSEKNVAFDKAADYLARGMKTEKQITDYLARKSFTPQVVQYVVDKLKEYRYVDDVAYAQAYVRQNSKNKGSRRIQQELLQRGIPTDKAQQFSQLETEQSLSAATELAQKYMKSKTADLKNLQRLQRYLLSRGYEFDTVNTVVRRYRDAEADD